MIIAVTMLAGAIVVMQCVCAINHMTVKTRHAVRFAYLALLLTAAAATLSPLYEIQPSGVDAALLLAVAGYVFANRRKTYLVT